MTVSTHAHVARGAPGARPERLVRSLTLGKRWKEPERGRKADWPTAGRRRWLDAIWKEKKRKVLIRRNLSSGGSGDHAQLSSFLVLSGPAHIQGKSLSVDGAPRNTPPPSHLRGRPLLMLLTPLRPRFLPTAHLSASSPPRVCSPPWRPGSEQLPRSLHF